MHAPRLASGWSTASAEPRTSTIWKTCSTRPRCEPDGYPATLRNRRSPRCPTSTSSSGSPGAPLERRLPAPPALELRPPRGQEPVNGDCRIHECGGVLRCELAPSEASATGLRSGRSGSQRLDSAAADAGRAVCPCVASFSLLHHRGAGGDQRPVTRFAKLRLRNSPRPRVF